jgi:23S rRNA (guanosine2251-2'-O)-methyltransferase
MIVYGVNPVLEALRAGRVTRVTVSAAARGRLREVLRLAGECGLRVQQVEPEALDRLAGGGAHQGVVAEVTRGPDYTVGGLVVAAGEPALIVVLDGIEDPQNLGAILRTADAAGAHGVVRQTRHAAPLGGAAAKASAGAVAHVRMAAVVNIARALDELSEAGVWTVGLAGDAPTRYDQVDLTLPTAIVLGAEGSGLRRLVRERCDWLVSIPMGGHVESLNVSVAAGIALFEARRQRRAAEKPGQGRPD